MINHQPTSPIVMDASGLLELKAIFPTIQGEGPFAGEPATFVRLAGCNLQCPFCDTDYTDGAIKVTPQYILDKLREDIAPNRLVVISGGEPFRQNIAPLIKLLLGNGFRVQIETNGSRYVDDVPYDQVTVVCSPKTGKINPKLLPHIDALKYVLHADQIDKRDGLPIQALGHSAKPAVAKPPIGFKGKVYVQPIDVQNNMQNARHLDATIRSAMKHGYTLCIQVHKVINVE